MPTFTHHIAWRTPYSFTEVVYDTAETSEITDNTLAEWANHAAAMEIVAEQAGLTQATTPSVAGNVPIVDEAQRRGAVPQQQAPTGSGELCPDCGGETAWKAVKKKDGSMGRVLECANPQHTDFRGGKTFPHTVRWA